MDQQCLIQDLRHIGNFMFYGAGNWGRMLQISQSKTQSLSSEKVVKN